MTGDERVQIAHVQQQLGEIRERIVGLETSVSAIKASQERNTDKLDMLVDRVADHRMESYKNGAIAAVVSAVVAALGGRVQ